MFSSGLFPFAGIFALGAFSWLIFYFVLFVLPFVLIIRKAGFSALWIIVAFIPVVNFIFLWVFALTRWPVEERRI
jgi:hypothetical protein